MMNVPRRKAYDIRFRCTLNGTDWTQRLWLIDPCHAFEAMYRCQRLQGNRINRNYFRVVECEVSPDQTRSYDMENIDV
jgi:hypothetical protein